MKIYTAKRLNKNSISRYIGQDVWILFPNWPGALSGMWVKFNKKYNEDMLKCYTVNLASNSPHSENRFDVEVRTEHTLPLRTKIPSNFTDIATTEELYDILVR